MIFFSIVIPTYNRRELLSRAISSALTQTENEFELIVVDDASTDDTELTIASIRDPRLRYIKLAQNRGNAFVRNRGFTQARGKFIVYLDDDDQMHPSFLQEMKQHLLESRSTFAWAGIEVYDAQNRYRGTRHSTFPDNSNLILKQAAVLRIGTCYGFTVKRSFLVELGGFDENLRSVVDSELFLRAIQHPVEWHPIKKVLVKVHRQESRLTKRSRQRLEDLRYVIARHHKFLEHRPEIKEGFYSELAHTSLANGERILARHALLSLLRLRPLERSYWRKLFANELRRTSIGRLLASLRRG